MKQKFIDCYMNIAEEVALLSYAVRKKVGTVIVSPDDLILIGYNGTPSGWNNSCEDFVHHDNPSVTASGLADYFKTKEETLHSEANAISKAAREGFKLKGATLFCTCSPCVDCAKLIHQAGIKEVIYKEQYRDTSGLQFLQKCGINVIQYKSINEEI